MGFSLVTLSTPWFLLLCMLLGAAYAGLLYYRANDAGLNRKTLILLALLRGISVSLIAFLLLSPLLKSTSRYPEKPLVLLALDNSSSITQGKDSLFYKTEFTANFRKLAEKLSGKYNVQSYTFGEKVENGLNAGFSGKLTNMEMLFWEIRDRYSNRNLAALVLATDGIYNQGADPLYVSDNAPYSIYTIALGDTNQQKDLILRRVNYNRIAFLGNDFPVEITVTAYRGAGAQSRISVTSGGQQLYAERFSVTSNDFSRTFNVRLNAAKPGLQRYRITVDDIPGEISKANNTQDILVDVMDGRQKILMLAPAPHPDVAALKQAIEKNLNYTVDNFLMDDFKGSTDAYSLVILCQLPSVVNTGFQVVNQLKNSTIPVLYIVGNQSDIPAYNNLLTGLKLPANRNSFNEATGTLNSDFSLFSVGPEVERLIPLLPPLQVPFGQYTTGTAAQVLISQRIGNVNTAAPLLLFNQGAGRKTATFVGEGIWRWRLANYVKAGNQDAFDELISKTIQYLSTKEDKSRFRVIMKNEFMAGEALEIDAELYNESYQLVNSPEVNILISDEKNKAYPFTFTRTAKAYYLNAGSLPPGLYSYKATTDYGGQSFQKSGAFSVRAQNIEAMNTVANHTLLNNIASRHKGKMLYPAQLNQVEQLLAARDDLKTIVYSQKRFTDLVSYLPFLLLIIGLLSAEWFIRKRSGGY